VARRILHVAFAGCLAFCLASGSSAHADGGSDGGATFSLSSIAVGNEFFAYGNLTQSFHGSSVSSPIPVGRRYVSCFYDSWKLWQTYSGGARQYFVTIWDACKNQAVIPAGLEHCYEASTNNIPPSCITLPARTVPAGYAPNNCGALAETSSQLFASLSPSTYDPAQATPQVATTSFGHGFAATLGDGTCTSILDWRAVSWSFNWPDGQGTSAGDSGQSGTTSAHTLAPQPGISGPQISDVTAVAHVHIVGQGVGFDGSGRPTIIPVNAFVDVSNKASAVGLGGPPLYTPPVLRVGGIGDGQSGDGAIPVPNLSSAPSQHLVTIRGHLLLIYPRAIVVSAGSESVGGVPVGEATTVTTSWRYGGGWTDAPPGEGTVPGGSGGTASAISLQWNNAEPLNGMGQPVDEQVPVTITAQTTYPDGHTATETVSGNVTVTIYYVALGYAG
jgi:hypothetical protein